MLIDLLNSSNYMMINRDAVRIFGLNTAVYCAELLNIYKKAVEKKKLIHDNYFRVDREYIKKQTTLDLAEQSKCDVNLAKVNVILIDPIDPEVISFNVEVFASLLSCQDVQILQSVTTTLKTRQGKSTRETQRARQILRLKESIQCKSYEIMMALRDWVDSIMSNPAKYVSEQQINFFKDRLDQYCGNDAKKALKIIEIATIHQYIDCDWAINLYERNNAAPTQAKPATGSPALIRSTNTKKIDKTGLSEEIF